MPGQRRGVNVDDRLPGAAAARGRFALLRQKPLSPSSPSSLRGAAIAHHEDMLTILVTPAETQVAQAEILGFDQFVKLPEGPLSDQDVQTALREILKELNSL